MVVLITLTMQLGLPWRKAALVCSSSSSESTSSRKKGVDDSAWGRRQGVDGQGGGRVITGACMRGQVVT